MKSTCPLTDTARKNGTFCSNPKCKECLPFVEKHPAEIIAEELVKIQDSMRQLLNSGLKRKAIIVLLQDMTKLNKKDIEYILNSLETIGDYWTTK